MSKSSRCFFRHKLKDFNPINVDCRSLKTASKFHSESSRKTRPKLVEVLMRKPKLTIIKIMRLIDRKNLLLVKFAWSFWGNKFRSFSPSCYCCNRTNPIVFVANRNEFSRFTFSGDLTLMNSREKKFQWNRIKIDCTRNSIWNKEFKMRGMKSCIR